MVSHSLAVGTNLHYHSNSLTFQPPPVLSEVTGVDLTSPLQSSGHTVPLITLNSGLSKRACISKFGVYGYNGLGAIWIGCSAVVVWSVAVEPELTARSLQLELILMRYRYSD